MRTLLAVILFLGIVLLATHVLAAASGTADGPFWRENGTAMNRMMAAMNVEPSGDVDRDFVAMMTPHHRGAIDMARLELRYGRNVQLRRLAEEIIVTQQSEIDAMKLALEPSRSAEPPHP